MFGLHPWRFSDIGVIQRAFVSLHCPLALANDIQIYNEIMKTQNYSIDFNLKNLLGSASADYAWEILQLEIALQTNSMPPLQELMRLIQLYMLGVEVLENQDDRRYNYFNNKIHSLMMRRAVVEQLHRIATGTAPDPETINKVQQMEMENRKNEYQLQISLQKNLYTINNIKDIISKEEHHTKRKNQHIKNELQGQNQILEERIRSRKLRSLSKGKQQLKEEKDCKIITKASYGSSSYHHPQAQKLESKYKNNNNG